MRKQIKLVTVLLSLSVVLAGCIAKNDEIICNDIPEQDNYSNNTSVTSDGEIQFDKDLKYDVYIEKKVSDPSDDENSNLDKKWSLVEDLDDHSGRFDPDLDTYMNFDYDTVDTKGLSKETLDLFEPCAMYLDFGANSYYGDLLSSRDYLDINPFLYYFLLNTDIELMNEGDADKNILRQHRMKYDEWDYVLREVLKENHPEKVRDKLSNTSPERNIFYNSDEDYIYMEIGCGGGYEEYAMVREVNKLADGYYSITYDLYWSNYLTGVAEITIKEADNKYGYSFEDVSYLRKTENGIYNKYLESK